MDYKEFKDKIEKYLAPLTADDLKNVIRALSDEVEGAQRDSFLQQLWIIRNEELPRRCLTQSKADALRKQVAAFAAAIDDGRFTAGWGWDDDLHDERDWGDESWAGQMDEYLRQLRKLVLDGEYALARDLYQILFVSFDQGHEPGHLPGHPDPAFMLEEDVDEHLAFYLVAVYLTTPPEARPAVLWDCLCQFDYIGDCFEIGTLTRCLETSLPDFDAFLTAWLDLLMASDHKHKPSAIRDVLTLQGLTAQALFASQHYSQFPETYIDWIDQLAARQQVDEAIKIAQQGIRLPDMASSAKAEIADHLARLAASRQNESLLREALWTAFDHSPSLDRLLRWFEQSYQPRDALAADAACQAALDRLHAHPSITLRGHALLLGGRLDEALALSRAESPTDLSTSNLNELILGFFLQALAQGGLYRTQIEHVWHQLVIDAVGRLLYEPDRPDGSRKIYEKLSGQVFSRLSLSPPQVSQMLEWAESQVDHRMATVLAGKHRSSYPLAARLAVAFTEALTDQGRISQAREFLGGVKNVYKHFSAFQRELKMAIQADLDFAEMILPLGEKQK